MYRPLSLDGKTAVVMGGTSGIGRALSLGLADAGADVIACSRRPDAVDRTACEIEQRGRRTLRIPADVIDRESLIAVRERVLGDFGKLDILINCAGMIKRTPALDLPEEEWASTLETNLTGTLRACQVFVPPMIRQSWGRIINIASLNSFAAFYEVPAYAASKAAVAGLTRSLAVEWARHGVNINAIAPGVFRTALNEALLDNTERGKELLMRTPARRFGRVEELAGAAVFLASEAASFVNGQILVVDGGFLASGGNQ
jgi:NAD(P)-dependent dehydrogenase (short-subunit alcohol dehydrogenase family)